MTIIIGIALMLLLALAFVLFFYFSQQKFQNQEAAARQKELAHQQQLLYSSIQVQEQERERVARELHDEIGSKLNVINLGLHQLKRKADPESITELFGVVEKTLSASRRLAHDLLPPTLAKFGLATAVQELCDQHQQTGEIDIDLELLEEELRERDQMAELNFYRVLQELLSNTLKYAQADNIQIKLVHLPQFVQLDYQDDGQGFDPSLNKHQKGLGLQNIESRLRMIDADFSLKSGVGEGDRKSVV